MPYLVGVNDKCAPHIGTVRLVSKAERNQEYAGVGNVVFRRFGSVSKIIAALAGLRNDDGGICEFYQLPVDL